jgi:hypothetical protein
MVGVVNQHDLLDPPIERWEDRDHSRPDLPRVCRAMTYVCPLDAAYYKPETSHMGMITEGQILRATERTNELLTHLFFEQQRTNQLLEALFRPPQTPTASDVATPAS